MTKTVAELEAEADDLRNQIRSLERKLMNRVTRIEKIKSDSDKDRIKKSKKIDWAWVLQDRHDSDAHAHYSNDKLQNLGFYGWGRLNGQRILTPIYRDFTEKRAKNSMRKFVSTLLPHMKPVNSGIMKSYVLVNVSDSCYLLVKPDASEFVVARVSYTTRVENLSTRNVYNWDSFPDLDGVFEFLGSSIVEDDGF